MFTRILFISAVLLGTAVAPEAHAASVPEYSGPLEVTVENMTGDPSLQWLSGAFEFHLAYFLDPYSAEQRGSSGNGAETQPLPYNLNASYELKGENVRFRIRWHISDHYQMEAGLEGKADETALWMTGLGGILLRNGFAVSSLRVSSAGPTYSTDALKEFIEVGSVADLQEQARILRRISKLDPDFREITWKLAIVHYRRGEFAEALENFTTYQKDRPASVPALLNRGLCLFRLGKMDESAELFREAAGLRSEDIELRYRLAGLLMAAGRLDEAEQVTQSLPEAAPGSAGDPSAAGLPPIEVFPYASVFSPRWRTGSPGAGKIALSPTPPDEAGETEPAEEEAPVDTALAPADAQEQSGETAPTLPESEGEDEGAGEELPDMDIPDGDVSTTLPEVKAEAVVTAAAIPLETGKPPEEPPPDRSPGERDIEQYRTANTALKELLEDKERQIMRLAREALAAQKKAARAEQELSRLDDELIKHRNELETFLAGEGISMAGLREMDDLRKERDSLVAEKTLLERVLEEKDKRISLIQLSNEGYEERLKGLEQTLADTGECAVELERREDDIAALREAREGLETSLGEGEEKIRSLEERVLEQGDRLARLEGEKDALTAELEGLQAQAREEPQETEQMEALREERDGLAAEKTRLEKAVGEKDRELSSLRKGLEGHRDELAKLEQSLSESHGKIDALSRQLEERDSEIAGLRENSSGCEDRIAGAQKKIEQLRTESEQVMGQLSEQKDRIGKLNGTNKDLENSLRENKEDLEQWRKTAGERKERLTRLEGEKASLAEELEGLRSKEKTHETAARETDALQKERDGLIAERSRLEKLLEEKKTELSSLRESTDEQAKEVEELAGRTRELDTFLAQERSRTQTLEEEREAMKLLIARLVSKIKENTSSILKLQKTLAEGEEELRSLRGYEIGNR